MNKEDARDFVLTFPAWIAPLVPNLRVTPQAIVSGPGKKDRLVYNASFMVDEHCRPFNVDVDLALEPDIYFASAYTNLLRQVYKLRISYLNKEIYPFDNDCHAAYRQVKYNPNVLPGKAFIIGKHLFAPPGGTFGDSSSCPNFEPMAQARMALAQEFSTGRHKVPNFPDYLNAVTFAPPPPPGTIFAQARPDCFNTGVLAADGSPLPVPFHMHVDDNLYAAAGQERLRWAMRCSIHALYQVMGDPDPTARANPVDFDKFVRDTITHQRIQLGFLTDTRTMEVTIPDDK